MRAAAGWRGDHTLDDIQLFSANSFGPSSNVLGCAAYGGTAVNGANTIVRNGSSGIELSGPGTSLINCVACNYIGIVNHDWGVPGIAPTAEATPTANGNGAEGIVLRNKAAFNVIGTAVISNGGLGIDRAVTSEGGNIVDAPPLTITQVNSAQGWSIAFADMRAGDCYTALVSDGTQSSEFSQNVCLPGNAAVARRKVMLPPVRR